MTDSVQQPPETTGQNPATEAAGQQSNDLTINDLNAMKSIIDIASSRGAFKPNEMMAVGQTYSKLETFLNNVAKQVEAQKKAEQGAQ
jgi:ribosomal protein S20